MADTSRPTLLVAGAGGQLGRRAVETLIESKAGSIIATTRHPEKLADLAARGVDVRKADYEEPASLAAAFTGADRMLLISTDALFVPGQRLKQHRTAIEAAQKAGVKHVVYTSAPAPWPVPGGSLMDDHFWTEVALFNSSMSWTMMRHNIYSEMLMLSLPNAVATGQLYTATGTGGRSFLSRNDCARADAAVLASSDFERRIYDVTGSESVTFDRLAAMVSELTGKTIAHVSLPPAALREGMLGAGLPAPLADAMVELDVAASLGYHAVVTTTVKDLTGQEPGRVEEFLKANLSALGAAH